LEQLIWTFSYAKSVVALLVDLCLQITSAGQLQRIHEGDYSAAGLGHITDKASRFMRAHLAQTIVDYSSSMGSDMVMQLVEHTLDLDAALAAECPPPLTVSSVLYDAKAIHIQWVEADHRYFSSQLAKLCANSAAVYGFKPQQNVLFGGEMSLRHAMAGLSSSSRKASTTAIAKPSNSTVVTKGKYSTQLRCYDALYDSLHLFSVACNRYQFMPPASQDIFNHVILEPMICITVGLFLYRIRSHPGLLAISDNNLAGALKHCGPDAVASVDAPPPAAVRDFLDSAQYFQYCLGTIITCDIRKWKSNKVLKTNTHCLDTVGFRSNISNQPVSSAAL
jgi:hypothetical protein